MNIKPVKPIEIVLFFALVLVLLALLSWVFPSDGIKLTDDVKVRFLSFDQITAEEPQYANLDSIVAAAKITDSLQQKQMQNGAAKDTSAKKQPAIDTVRASASTLRERIQRIEFPRDNTLMFEPFFEELRSGNVKKSLIRILHYGDSQIEGDRITRYLRNRFQKSYSGSGPGLLPTYKPVSENSSMQISTEGPWEKHTVMLQSDSTFDYRNYGILGSCSKLEGEDSTLSGKLNYKISNYSYMSSRHFRWARLFFGRGGGDFNLSIYEKDSLLLKDIVSGAGPLNYFGLQLNHTPEDLTFEVSGDSLPVFYAVSFDQPSGIAVDNIAWRGSRGAEFYKMRTDILSRFFRQLNVKLIVFQFGVNVVPHIVNSYGFYERQLVRQLTHLKKAAGEIPVLVVGVSDMSRKKHGWYESYPNITKIRNAQRNAAFKSNCAFWDMYEAMGGHNSMPAWVFAQPPLARKDFTHFNFRGARIIARMMYNAIMYEYNNYSTQNIDSTKVKQSDI
ncbi:hypothetical protein L21SP5_00668 [Salinivirga cyanobacteriivorans]|uniref:Uncharacterized protein n=1 Tax=Salinivirga cyanobacteriivorans TaxID=1307839 RepID=A0A0S2HWL9_9BACT|nr:hypothetical protein [Salinivirga cyanobacteriivorans]ALO14340.1 hypothetical protein L21SP5_00668 [Salinivirga cyanobacteriivorans]